MLQDEAEQFCCLDDFERKIIEINKSVRSQEPISFGLFLNNSKEEDGKDINQKTDKEVLPLANPYIATYLIVIVTTAVLFNSLVLTVLCFRRKKLQAFQLCMIAVCISDLLFSLLLHPMSILTALGFNSRVIFNHSGCLFFGVLALLFGSFDMVIHSCIALLRYINVCHPAKMEWFSKKTIWAIIAFCVFYSVIWCIGPLFGIGRYVTFEVGCTMAFSDDSWSGRTFVNSAFIFIFLIPLTITIFSYVAIVMKASKQRRLLERIGTVSNVANNGLTVQLKLVRLTSVIAAAYITVWFPYAIVCLAEAYGNVKAIPWIFRILAALFCKTGTATNPIIYLFMSKGFRRETAETVRYLLRRSSPNHLHSSSQKSSSYRSNQSQISLRSARNSQARKDRSNIHKKILCARTDSYRDGMSLSAAETEV